MDDNSKSRLSDVLNSNPLFIDFALSVLRGNGDLGEISTHLSSLMDNADDQIVVFRAAYLLGWIQSTASITILRNKLKNPSPLVREASVFVLGQIAEQESAEELVLMLYDQDKRVRRMAATVIGWAGGDFHLDIIEKHNIIHDLDVHEELKSILQQIASKRAIQYLKKIVMDSDEQQ